MVEINSRSSIPNQKVETFSYYKVMESESKSALQRTIETQIIGRVTAAAKLPLYFVAIAFLAVKNCVRAAVAIVATPVYMALKNDESPEKTGQLYRWTFHAVAKDAILMLSFAIRVMKCASSLVIPPDDYGSMARTISTISNACIFETHLGGSHSLMNLSLNKWENLGDEAQNITISEFASKQLNNWAP